jgi:DNA adenine methylase
MPYDLKYTDDDSKAKARKERKEMIYNELTRGSSQSGTHRLNVFKKYNLEDKGYSLEELSKVSSVPLNILQEVYDRGIGAYKTTPTSVRLKNSFVKNVDAPMSQKLSKEQWAMARVYSFLDGNPKHDEDLRKNKEGKLEGGLKPISARIGGKVLLKKTIVNEYFPNKDSYNTYVEPFVGGGSIYFYKNKDGKKEVVNDIDPDVYEMFKGFQTYEGKDLSKDINGDYTEEDFNKIKASEPTKPYNKFLKTYLLHKLSYLGRGLTFGKDRISANFDSYKERLKGVEITKDDYKDVIKKYNEPTTFFYLDPPAIASSGTYQYTAISPKEFADVLKTIKGKFLVTLEEESYDKELFKDYYVVTLESKQIGNKNIGGQSDTVKEYIIMNYKQRKVGGCSSCGLQGDGIIIKIEEPVVPVMCGGCMGDCGGSVSEFQKKLDSIGLKPNIYLKKAKELAEYNGYDASKVMFCNTGKNKLMFDSPDGLVHFGNPQYPDYIIYSFMESKNQVEKGTADKRRELYRARATNIKGNWRDNRFSPNNLAIKILW